MQDLGFSEGRIAISSSLPRGSTNYSLSFVRCISLEIGTSVERENPRLLSYFGGAPKDFDVYVFVIIALLVVCDELIIDVLEDMDGFFEVLYSSCATLLLSDLFTRERQ